MFSENSLNRQNNLIYLCVADLDGNESEQQHNQVSVKKASDADPKKRLSTYNLHQQQVDCSI